MIKSEYTANNSTVSDQQLVDYVLKLLPEGQYQVLAQRIEQDNELQQRLIAWENALFTFHADTEEKTPSKQVWQRIEQQLFASDSVNAEMQTEREQNKHRFWGFSKYLMPTLVAFCLIFGVMFWLQNPTYQVNPQSQYHASVDGLHFPITVWEVEGDRDSIAFTSIWDVSEKGWECIAWLKQGDNAPIRLGAVPDTGDKTSYRIDLPENLTAGVGDRVIIAMVPIGETQLPPISEQHIVELSRI